MKANSGFIACFEVASITSARDSRSLSKKEDQ